MEKGYVQLYTGNGKGKTTASMGLAFRASGNGMKTLIIQFMKGGKTSENSAAEKNSFIQMEQYGMNEFYIEGKSDILQHRNKTKQALDRALECLKSGSHDILVLDEIINALKCNLVSFDEVLNIINMKPAKMELVLTGRNAPEELYEHCDLVTEFREIKHYYRDGVKARQGIEF